MAEVVKAYDRAYFDRWYRSEGAPRGDEELRRQVALAVATAESVLDRPIESVLDVGCGEGRWQPVLRRLRRDASYLGIDPSPYAVQRFGDRRNIMSGSYTDLATFAFEEAFDLLVCVDVLHYLGSDEVLRGMDALAGLVGGVAILEVFAEEDEVEGDHDGFVYRPAAWYRRVFEGAGLVPIGLQMYVHRETAEDLDALDRSG